MRRVTHPYFLIFITAVLSAAMAVPVANRRARIAELRREQEKQLSSLIHNRRHARFLRKRREELLTDPDTITEVALEHYGFTLKGRRIAGEKPLHGDPYGENPPQIKIVESGWAGFLGSGEYPWKIPVVTTCLLAGVFALLGLFSKNKSKQKQQDG